jgi:hypothetical protein
MRFLVPGSRPALAGIARVAVGASCGGGGGGGGGFLEAQDRASVLPSPAVAARNSGPGDFAADYLRDTHFDEIVVEVDYPARRLPTTLSLSLLEARLEERCRKANGVRIVLDDALPDSTFVSPLSVQDLHDIEDAHRDFFSDESTGVAAVYLLYVLGSSDLDSPSGVVLGLSHRGGSCALFADNADQGPAIYVTTAEVEGTGLVHEFGHLLGLVNGGTPTRSEHEDVDHAAHCATGSCVMFWQVRVPFTTPNIGDPDFAQFDAACVADIQAMGGK